MLRIQLDDRALFLARWRDLLLGLLTPDALALGERRAELREVVDRGWTGRASVDSPGYRIVRAFRIEVAERVIGRIDLGQTWTDDFRSLPPRIRFFAGGDRSVRGYGYQEIGPLDVEDNVIGGEALATAGIELDSLFFDFDKFGRWGAAHSAEHMTRCARPQS